MDENLLKEYDKEYVRKSDGRKFLCRNITPNDCKMYDTVDKVFYPMSTTKRSIYYKSTTKKYHKANKNKQRVSGAKVRELRKKGFSTAGGKGDWE